MAKKSMFAMFDSDADLEVNGVWLDYGSEQQIKLARAGGANEKFKRLLTAAMKPHKRLMEAEQMPDDLAESVMRTVYAKAVLLDWRGVTDMDGADLPYSYDNVMDVFVKFPAFFQDVIEQSGKLALFQAIEEEEDAGN
jgi:hypothetical protein